MSPFSRIDYLLPNEKLNLDIADYFCMMCSSEESFNSLGLVEIRGAAAPVVGGAGDGGDGGEAGEGDGDGDMAATGGGGAGGGKGGGGEVGGEESQLALLIRNTSLSFEDWIYLHGDQLVVTSLV